MKPKFIRWNFFIYPKFQLQLFALNTLVLCLVLTPIGIQIYRTYSHLYEIGTKLNFPETHPYFQFLNLQKNMIGSAIIVSMGLGVVVSFIVTLLASHRMAGPIYRLKTYLNDLAKTGKFTPIKFRKNDYLNDIAPVLNSLLEKK